MDAGEEVVEFEASDAGDWSDAPPVATSAGAGAGARAGARDRARRAVEPTAADSSTPCSPACAARPCRTPPALPPGDHAARNFRVGQTYAAAAMLKEAADAFEKAARDPRYRFRSAQSLGRLYREARHADRGGRVARTSHPRRRRRRSTSTARRSTSWPTRSRPPASTRAPSPCCSTWSPNRATTVMPAPASSACRASRRDRSAAVLRQLLFVAYLVEAGLVLLIVRGRASGSATRSSRWRPRWMVDIARSGWARGAVSGVGLLLVGAGLAEAVSIRTPSRVRRPPVPRTAVRDAAAAVHLPGHGSQPPPALRRLTTSPISRRSGRSPSG